MKTVVLILPLILALGACASLDGWLKGADLGAYQRGRAVYDQKCASCHEIHARRLAMPGGPTPVDEIARRYSDRSLDREMEVISEFGHYAMPPTPVTPAERGDLVVYISSFRK